MWRCAGWLARSRWRRLGCFSRKDEDTFHEDYQTAVNTEPDVYVIWMLASIRFADTTPQTTPQPWVKRLPDRSPIVREEAITALRHTLKAVVQIPDARAAARVNRFWRNVARAAGQGCQPPVPAVNLPETCPPDTGDMPEIAAALAAGQPIADLSGGYRTRDGRHRLHRLPVQPGRKPGTSAPEGADRLANGSARVLFQEV